MPRIVPKDPPDVVYAAKRARAAHSRTQGFDPYFTQHTPHKRYDVGRARYSDAPSPERDVAVPSFFGDLVLAHEAEQRELAALESPLLRGKDQGDPSNLASLNELAEARERLKWVNEIGRYEQRDIGSGSTPDLLRPSAPGYLIQTWGRAAAQTASLLDTFERRPLERGMVDAEDARHVQQAAGVPA